MVAYKLEEITALLQVHKYKHTVIHQIIMEVIVAQLCIVDAYEKMKGVCVVGYCPCYVGRSTSHIEVCWYR